MARSILFSMPTITFICFFFIQLCTAIELKPIRPKPGSGAGRRDASALDFTDEEMLLWGAADGEATALANFTIYMPATDSHILSIEKFSDMLLSSSCTPTSMTLQFIDDATFAYAQSVWDWVNGADNNTFLMVAGESDDCIDEASDRTPYLIKALRFDEESNTAYLDAEQGEWKDLVTSYQMKLGSIETPLAPQGNNPGVAARDITQDLSVSLAQDLPLKVKLEQGPIVGELECVDCGLTGRLVFAYTITQNVAAIPNGVEFSVRPEGVSAKANLKLNVGSNFKSKKEVWKENALSFPLNGFTIPQILSIGPFLDIDVGGEVTGLEGQISITSGATCSLSDSAILKANLLEPNENQFSGWTPNIDFTPPTIEAKVSTTLQMFFMPAVRLKAEVLNEGVETGLELKLPFIDFKIEATANAEGGVCGDPKKTLGVEVQPSIGAELKFAVGTTDGGKRPVDITIATTSFDLGDGICFGGDPDAPDNPSTTQGTSTGSTATTLKTSTTAAAPAASCTADNGISGTCISTSSCATKGGISEAGHCPGAADIQCCYQPEGSSTTCEIDDGTIGTCMLTSTCAAAGARSVPGFCPGAADVQCCVSQDSTTEPADPEGTGDTCEIDDGTNGTCMPTTDCPSSTGRSVPGFCRGPSEVQCCVSKETATPEPESPEGTGDTCEIDDGTIGTCMPTEACPSSTGRSVPGFCQGPSDVQCCVAQEEAPAATPKPEEPEGTGDTCEIDDGTIGTCMPTGDCPSSTGRSVPGFCRGGSDVQCCVSTETKTTATRPIPTNKVT